MITHNIPLFCGKAKYDPHKASRSGLEVIKLEYRLRLKMRNDWLVGLYFEAENEFKFNNLEARCYN